MYFEISYHDDLLKEIQLSDIGKATNIQKILEGLFEEFDEEYGLTEEYGDDEDAVGCFVTDLVLTPVYND